ncbi:AMPKBI-domain-containing protein [Lojkania enalia]|uniref:AMPKBI-domain-containing protein n=1 Tax=Lojkania enalia TaxID=147567 RepID=A0A9P4N2X8_9PLEO|nr:AMPKBI-domain-containing protein [Didymosphaeria enalia]
MGNEQSRHKGYVHGHQHQHQLQHQHHHGQHGQHPSDTAPPKPKLPAPPPIHPQQQQQQPAPSPQTQPVDVPSLPKDESYGGGSRSAHASSIDPADASEFFIQPSQYSRPPRLPLPIEEEVHTPGSPIISPVDLTAPIAIDQADTDGVLPRRASVSSSTTVEEDALADDYQPVSNQPTVPTVIEWEGPGDRVYVTGTFAGWNKKYRLHKNGPSPKKDVLSTVINIIPGTHHLKFIVDNDMRTSDKLPTAVDYTNILVNYLEVSLDDLPQQATDTPKEPQQPEPAPPEPVPVLEPPKPKTPVNTVVSPKRYHQRIPRYLLDLDAPEESSRMARASAATSNLPTPPSLPMFLSKSILNGTTPMKDDSSVLILPNHTVLNHLATSSIKDNILATSATTRYKQKFLTTVMYKPKNDDPDRERN